MLLAFELEMIKSDSKETTRKSAQVLLKYYNYMGLSQSLFTSHTFNLSGGNGHKNWANDNFEFKFRSANSTLGFL